MYNIAKLLVVFSLCGFTCSPPPRDIPKPPEVKQATAVSVAFDVSIEETMWKLVMNPSHFGSEVASLALHYNNIYYGVFMPTDTVFLPLLVAPEAEVLITAVDQSGKPLSTESFTLRRTPDAGSSKKP